jgi:hypothetical protein
MMPFLFQFKIKMDEEKWSQEGVYFKILWKTLGQFMLKRLTINTL